MSSTQVSDRLTSHSHRLVFFISLLIIVIVALRRRYDISQGFTLTMMIILLVGFTLLFATEPLVTRRVKSYRWVYFTLQLIIVQILGVFREYQDTWALLYIVLGFQVSLRCARKEAYTWFVLFGASILFTMLVEYGLVSGPGRALAYVVMGVLLISYDIQYAQHEVALAESQVLVAELQEAHQKLTEYTAQAEKLAALQQRNIMLQELYDSVGQKVFAIQLAAETTRLTLAKDPSQAVEKLADLQVQTQSALSQMRQLIEQWRPG